MARVQTSRRNCRRAVMVAPWVSSRRRRQIRYTLEARRFGEVAESAEGSRLLSGYRGKTSVPGSNPGLSAIQLAHRPSGPTSQEELSVAAKPGTGLMMAGAIVAFSGLCIVLVEVLRVPPYAVLLVVGVGMFVLGLIRRFSREDRDRI